MNEKKLNLANKPATIRAIAGGRAVQDHYQFVQISPRSSQNQPSQSYRLLNLQRKQLFNLPFRMLKELAFDLSPELNKTLWDFQRYCNPGYIIEGESDRAVSATQEFIDELADIHGSFDNLLEVSFGNLFKDGSTIKELVLSEDARTPIDVYIPDPNIAEFRKLDRGARGKVWVLGQIQDGAWTPLEDEAIFYLALDGSPDRPQGKSLINPAIYDSISLILIKQAVQRVLENQGYSRQDYIVRTEALLRLIEHEDQDLSPYDQDQRDANEIDRFIQQVKSELENKEVDSDYVHSDIVEVNYAAGTLSGNSLNSVDSFVHRLQQGITVGGKSIPLLLGDNESLAESQADRSLETYVDGTITPIQEKESQQWSSLFTLANRVRGIRGAVSLKFQKRRVRDLKSIAETEKIQLENILTKLQNDFISQADAVREIEMLHDPLII